MITLLLIGQLLPNSAKIQEGALNLRGSFWNTMDYRDRPRGHSFGGSHGENGGRTNGDRNNGETSSRELFVAGLDQTASEELLFEKFSPFGDISSVRFKIPASGNAFAFIQYSSGEDAAKAVQSMRGTKIGEKMIAVRYSKPRTRREDGGEGRQFNRRNESSDSRMDSQDRGDFDRNRSRDKPSFRPNSSRDQQASSRRARNDSSQSTPSFRQVNQREGRDGGRDGNNYRREEGGQSRAPRFEQEYSRAPNRKEQAVEMEVDY